ncbi:DNA damage-regulated autophagy modulator protein 2-like [Apostichopus japonicus]|uniref:DNA damage-regulated autophagy modulator protein 2-like n=1 Tax=Stichopus japonicus TaxID=307972 RepID=UPI003AB29C17
MEGCRGLCLVLLPIALAILGPIMLVTSYTIAVLHGDVAKLFPYISDTGGDAPESCIFGQFLNMISLIMFVGVMLRYKQVDSMVITLGLHRLNGLTVFLGCLCALGGSLVANFQDTHVMEVHYLGALLLFGFGIVYCFAHTYISYKINRLHLNERWACHLRLALTTLAAVSFVSCLVGSHFAEAGWNKHHVHKSYYYWGPEDGGYTAHLVSTFSEWVMSVALMGFFVTYIPDFLHIDLVLELRFFQRV